MVRDGGRPHSSAKMLILVAVGMEATFSSSAEMMIKSPKARLGSQAGIVNKKWTSGCITFRFSKSRSELGALNSERIAMTFGVLPKRASVPNLGGCF